MSEAQTITMVFNDVNSYKEYKDKVIAGKGIIKHDYESLMYFTAIIPPAVVDSIRSASFSDKGIRSIEADSVATIQS